MNKISTYLIAYNQVDRIQAAIESVSWANEIVVVDSHSTDGTTALAERLGARVIQVPFTGFGALRNAAVAACQYEWIFNIDTDERCTNAARDEILSIVHCVQVPHDVYFVLRHNYFMGRLIRHSGWYPDYREQLFRKGCLSCEEDRVHERYVVHSQKPVGYLTAPIMHYPFQNLAELMHKTNRYSTLGIERLEKKYVKPSMWRGLLHTLWTFGRVYFLKRGFLDGWRGLIIAMSTSYGAFYRYAKHYEKSCQEELCKPLSQSS